MKTVTEVEPFLSLIECQERRFYIVGTAHVSKNSVELVCSSIQKYQPDCVCVELCQARAQAIRNPDRWRETDIFKVIKEKKAYVVLAQLLLASFQKRIAKKLGIEPGAEMRAACQLSEEKGIALVNADREIRITLRRAWARMGWWSLIKVFASALCSYSTVNEISEKEIEELRSGDMLAGVMSDFSAYLPGVKEVLIDERDKYLAAKILSAPGRTVLAVVGAGHVPGICREFGSVQDLSLLEKIPPRSFTGRLISLAVPLIILLLFAHLFFNVGTEASTEMLSTWVIAHSVFSGLGAALALAHPLTILTAVVATPLTSIIRTIPGGWLCALVEAFLRKPRVKDLEELGEDICSLRGFWRNRVSRILLVIVLVNLGSFAGTVLGYLKAVSLLK